MQAPPLFEEQATTQNKSIKKAQNLEANATKQSAGICEDFFLIARIFTTHQEAGTYLNLL